MPLEGEGGGGGTPQSCFTWFGTPWGKDYPGWKEFRQALVDHGADVNGWIDAHPTAAACIKAVKDAPPGAPPPSSPPPPTDRFCFEWGGQKWGQDHPGWKPFRAWLIDHGDDPNTWIAAHPGAAKCIGATALAKCFDWGGSSWGKDYPGWTAFHKWLVDHGDDPQAWIDAHPQAAACIGAPPPTPSPAPAPPPAPAPAPPPAPGPTGGPPTPPYNANGTPWDGRGVYCTTDPMLALQFIPGCQWCAVRPDFTTAEQVQELAISGFTVSAWEPSATPAGVEFALANCSGYIAQAEVQGQLEAALAVKDSLGSFPRALVTNVFMLPYPSDWVCHVEAYENEQAGTSMGGYIQNALDHGATVVVPVCGIYAGALGNPGAQHYLDEAAALGVTSLAAYEAGSMPADDVAVWGGVPPGDLSSPSAPPGGGAPPPSTLPTSPAGLHYCFEWGGEYWGGDYPGWEPFKAWLIDHGADPEAWILAHEDAASCLDVAAGVSGGGQAQSVESKVCNPWEPGAVMMQHDNGMDAQGPPGGRVKAICDGYVVGVYHDPPGYGDYIVYKCVPGGEEFYVGHGFPLLHSGDITAGDPVVLLTSPSGGNANHRSWWSETGFANGPVPTYQGQGSTGGDKLAAWLASYGITKIDTCVNRTTRAPYTPPPPKPGTKPPPPKGKKPPEPSGGAGTGGPKPLAVGKFKEPPATVASWAALKAVFARKVPSTRSSAPAIIDNPKAWLK